MRKALLIGSLLLIIGLDVHAFTEAEKRAHHEEVVMRMIGHQVLLAAGDSSTQVLPVERDGDAFTLQFAHAIRLDPDVFSTAVDSVIDAQGLSNRYIVEFISCDAEPMVVYSYERNAFDSLMPCLGRPQPEACYQLRIVLLDRGSGSPLDATDEAGGSVSTFLVLIGLLLAFATGMAVHWRSGATSSSNQLSLGRFQFDPDEMMLLMGKERTELTGKESALLLLFSNSRNETIARDILLKEVWGDDGDYVGRTLDVFISKLRKKLEPDPEVKILNIRGVGYKLVTRA